MIEGTLGGLSTLSATINAYLSDVTPDGSRAAVFARLAGTTMLGFASGPVLGSLLIQLSGNM
jgi:MFS family permease